MNLYLVYFIVFNKVTHSFLMAKHINILTYKNY